MTVLETWLDGAVGETRMALVRAGTPIALALWRASDVGRRARWGETYAARIASVDRRRRGAFVDLGLGAAMGFLPLDAKGGVRVAGASVAIAEGQRGFATITREAVRAKSAVVEWRFDESADRPGFVARHRSDEPLLDAPAAAPDVRTALDEAFEAAADPQCLLPGGGRLIIEPTAALAAIDVDAADRPGPGDPERFALELNLAAAEEALRQIRLRDLGGLIAIDFVSMRTPAARDAVMTALKANKDPWGLAIAPMSRFGVVEIARPQLRRPLHEALSGASARETTALAALRAIESAARAQAGRRVVLQVQPALEDWLQSAPFDWRDGLDRRIGRRWSMATNAALRRPFEAFAE